MDEGSLQFGLSRAVAAMGDRWSLQIMMTTSDEPRTFGEIGRALGTTDSVISKRVTRLLDHGLVEREAYCQRPVRYRYSATALAKQLRMARIATWRWDQTWAPESAGRSVHFVHSSCARQVVPAFGCGACGAIGVTMYDIHTVVHDAMRAEMRHPAVKRSTRIRSRQRVDALSLIGDHWSTAIISVVLLGTRTFNDIRFMLGAVSAATLTEKLTQLVTAGLLTHESRGTGARRLYRPTPKAHDLFPIFASIVEWARLWGEPVGVQFNHTCGNQLVVRYTCNACNEPLEQGKTLFISNCSR